MWKDIPGYEGIYEASTTGQIRSKEGKVTYSERHGKRVWKSRVLKQKIGKDKCCRVTLYKNKKEKTLLVHRLVAATFLTKINGKEFVNHIDGNRLNNAVENLEWCNHTENNNHAFDNDLIKTGKKVILKNLKTGEIEHFRSLSKASEQLGKNVGYISNSIKRGSLNVEGYEVYIQLR